jgi:hypothetical protein
MSEAKGRLALLALLTVLTIVVTYPQITHLTTGVHDFGDPLLNAWALAWTPHALVSQPASLFDANIFHPERGTLALSETLIAPALVTAPLHGLGANAILLHNVTLLSGFVLSGFAMFMLVRSLTADWRAALLAAVAFTVTPLRLEHYPRVQLQLTYLMPVALYFVHRVVDGDMRRRAAIFAGLSCGLLFYSNVYFFTFFATLLPLIVVMPLVTHRARLRAIAVRFGIAGLVTLAVVAPAVLPYLHNRRTAGERHIEELRHGSAELRDYRRSNPVNWLHGDWRRIGPAERHLFPGYVVSAAALAAAASPAGRWIPYATALAASVELSLGVNGRAYPWLYTYALPYRALRVPARAAMLAHMLLAVLAGLGAAALLRRLHSPRARNAVMLVLLAGVVLESVNRPVTLRDMPAGVPAVYEWLRAQPDGPILEYPVGSLEGRSGPQDATYMYYSTSHWRRMLNGYSGFSPPSYHAVLHELRDFPDAPALEYLRQRDVRYLLVHENFYLHGGFDADIEQLSHSTSVAIRGVFQDRALGRSYAYEILK